MWASSVGQDAISRVSSQRSQWHRDQQSDVNRLHAPPTVQEVESQIDLLRGRDERYRSGTWGERDVGDFDEAEAIIQFAALRRDLTDLRGARSNERDYTLGRTLSVRSALSRRPRTRERPNAARTASEAAIQFAPVRRDITALRSYRTQDGQTRLQRTISNRTAISQPPTVHRRQASHGTFSLTESHPEEVEEVETELSNGDAGKIEEEKGDDDDDLELGVFLKEGHFEKRDHDESAKKVGVIFKDLTVKGVGATAAYVRTLPDAVLGTFGPDLYRILVGFIPSLDRQQGELRTLLNGFTGCVRDGEMMLVLGRPGSGCSSLLKVLANNRTSYAEVTGEISYGGISAEKQKKMYRGEVVYNMEDDVHFASLNVWQTFLFALYNKTPKRAREEVEIVSNALLKMFGISHTKYTPVGDDFVRGVSGGERKRVSIAETLASKATVIAWDNSTRGLDASTALDYARSLRIMTDISNRTTLTTLYQAGEGIYQLMDKVLVIDEGRQIYMGPAHEARQYFIDLGFECPERQTTADFLTAVTDPVERRFRPGCEHSTPKTAEELEAAFRSSPSYQKVLADISDYETYLKETNYEDTKNFENAVQEGKSKHVPTKSPYTVSFPRQVIACTKRELWLLLGDTTALWTKLFVIISNGLIVGSLFYGESLDTSGTFSRGGVAFFSVLFLGWLQLAELMKAVSGRAVVARHKDYAFYRPSAVTIARVITDFPVILIQTCIFGLIMYFMCNLDVTAGKFWIYMLFVYVTTILLTALYRMFASLSPEIDTAVRFSGIALNLLIIYTGYVIPKPQLLSKYIWFGWIYWINPLSYAFEAVLSNEFAGRTMECAPSQLVPQGPGVDPQYQGCAVPGARVGARSVTGSAYLNTQYNYSRSHLWRNFGVVVGFTILYILVTMYATETMSFSGGGGGAFIFKKTRKAKRAVQQSPPADEEKAVNTSDSNSSSRTNVQEAAMAEDEALQGISKSDSIFTWRDVNYKVPYLGGERQLLNNVNGYARPGKMIALMGASGAGKTTLLNTLAQRQTMGVVGGEMFVDGRPLGPAFQRNTGFCLQGDIHDGTATIREALEFSAILRQDSTVPRAEKLAYVDKIVDLLELNDLQDALIMSLGVEQRKRVTIGVELAAKPSLLLFLDEPTSGLDSQSAFSIIRFLKKLASAGQAIVCTIHQPSSVLIQQFDQILALNPGGNCFYFGPVGENGQAVIDYFAARGTQCPPNKNVAEFILETAARPGKRGDGSRIDWNKEWRDSPEAQSVIEEIESLKLTRSKTVTEAQRKEVERAFAASTWLQTSELTKRTFRQYWRSPSYLYGKLFVAVIVGIFNGFTFWQLGYSILDLQNRMFTSFLALTIPPTVVNAVLPKFFGNMALWQAREHPSRIYNWFAFTTAQVVAEIPPAILSGTIYWVLWYWPTGLPTESSVSGYVFLMTILFFLFQASWGQWICAFAPTFTVISNVLPSFFVMFTLFNGVVRPYSTLPVFWKYWMYWLNPSTYWIGGVLAATLHNIPVQCTDDETARFNAPPGQTCVQYAGDFARQAGGYLLNPQANNNCMYCPYQVGDQYLSQLNIQADQKWRDFGIFLIFVFSNWFLVYFFIYTVRVKGWSFGFGYVFGALGKLVDLVTKPLVRLFGRKKQ